jgi:Tol biopolymer transport system component
VLTTLTNDGENNHSPVWSPDGFFLGFVKGEPDDESPGIYYVLADGTGIAQVLESADAEDYDVDWKQP